MGMTSPNIGRSVAFFFNAFIPFFSVLSPCIFLFCLNFYSHAITAGSLGKVSRPSPRDVALLAVLVFVRVGKVGRLEGSIGWVGCLVSSYCVSSSVDETDTWKAGVDDESTIDCL